jgi:hypothetical protein
MKYTLAMASARSTEETIQAILTLRHRAPQVPEEILYRIRAIESLLHDNEAVVPNWRRGISGNNSQVRGRQQGHAPQPPPNARWKNTPPVEGQNQGQGQVVQNQKYQSRFKNTDAGIDDTILNTIILNKLNKFSASTYTDVRDFLYQILDSGQTDFTKEFMRLVFKKAAAEDMYCPLYARLLSELRTTYPVIQTEMSELFHAYLTIFHDVDESDSVNYKAFVERNLEKKYRLGYSQFLAELVILETVDLASLEKTFEILICNISRLGWVEGKVHEVQEYADCLLRMSKVVHKKNTGFFVNLRKQLYEVLRVRLEEILNSPKEDFPSLVPKSRFALMDIRDNLQK